MWVLLHGKAYLGKFPPLKYINNVLGAAQKTHTNKTGAYLKKSFERYIVFYPTIICRINIMCVVLITPLINVLILVKGESVWKACKEKM